MKLSAPRFVFTLLATGGLFAGCAETVKVAPLTVQPIHITVDVNLHDKAAPVASPAAATSPAAGTSPAVATTPKAAVH